MIHFRKQLFSQFTVLRGALTLFPPNDSCFHKQTDFTDAYLLGLFGSIFDGIGVCVSVTHPILCPIKLESYYTRTATSLSFVMEILVVCTQSMTRLNTNNRSKWKLLIFMSAGALIHSVFTRFYKCECICKLIDPLCFTALKAEYCTSCSRCRTEG